MICWYCYWGWPKPVADIYLEALNRLNGDESPLRWGPAHIVWEDENFHSAQSCLDDFGLRDYVYTAEQLDIVRWSLEELAKLPSKQYAEPEDYDGEHPESYPPPWEVVKV